MTPPKTYSAYEKSKRSPIKWIVLIIILIFVNIRFVVPKTQAWVEKGDFIKTNTSIIESLKVKKGEKEEVLKTKKEEREDFRKEKRLTEIQRFPESIDIHKIVQIIEIFALQIRNLNSEFETSFFELNNIDFGTPRSNQKESTQETPMEISFRSDDENFREFISFLQSGMISQRIENSIENGQIDSSIGQFLKNNFIPILHIQNIQYQEQEEENFNETIFNVNIDTVLFSQYQNNDQ